MNKSIDSRFLCLIFLLRHFYHLFFSLGTYFILNLLHLLPCSSPPSFPSTTFLSVSVLLRPWSFRTISRVNDRPLDNQNDEDEK